MKKRYNDLNTYFKDRYGTRVHKLTIDAGFTCPNRDGSISSNGCIYCNDRGSGSGAYKRGLSIKDQLLKSRAAAIRRYKTKKFIAYFQAFTSTYADFDTLKRYYDEALAVEGIIGLAIGTRPDCITPKVLDLLESYAQNKLIWLEYGLQSSHDVTLTTIERGHDVQCFIDAVQQSKGRKINICAHVILGLPGESLSHALKTADFINQLSIDGVKIHLLYVIRNTLLAKAYREKTYRCLTQEEYVRWVVTFIEHLSPGMIIQRLTSDPNPNELIAPLWATKKRETAALILRTFEAEDTWQGKYYTSPNPR